MFDIEELKKQIEAAEAKLRREADAEYATEESALVRRIEICRAKEEEIGKLLKSSGISNDMVNRAEREVEDESTEALEKAQKELEGTPEEILLEENEQVQSMELLRMSSIATGASAGSHWWGGGNPYYCCGSINKHNEGGITTGGYSCPKYAISGNKMYPWALARGDGKYGWTDDNDVTVRNILWFAYWPTAYSVVRPAALISIHGWYSIYSNDKWWNHKWAKIRLDVGIDVSQNYWAGATWINIKNRSRDNINENGRIDRLVTIVANPLAVGPGKWVLIPVTAQLRVETEGGGTHGRLQFTGADFISARMLWI